MKELEEEAAAVPEPLGSAARWWCGRRGAPRGAGAAAGCGGSVCGGVQRSSPNPARGDAAAAATKVMSKQKMSRSAQCLMCHWAKNEFAKERPKERVK